MTDETSAPGAGADTAAPVAAPANLDSSDSFTPEQAFEAYKKRISPAESAPQATAEQESAPEADAAPETAPSEDTTEAEPADDLPPIERPRSWTKDVDDVWQDLPRALQEKVAAREQDRERELRRTQNEAAEKLKGLTAKEQEVEQARKAYEAKLPALLEAMQRQSEFADIRTLDDVKKLQAEDPFRFQAWQVYQMDAQAVEAERRQAEERQIKQKMEERTKYAQEQDAKLHELLPEMADPEKAGAIRTKAINMLVDDYGFSQSELGAVMQSDEGFKLLSDARWQKLIADGLKYAELRKAPVKAIPKPVPAVQKPGVGRAPGAASADAIQASRNKLNSTGSMEDAFALYQSKKARAR